MKRVFSSMLVAGLCLPALAQQTAPFGEGGVFNIPPKDGEVYPAGFIASRTDLNNLLGGAGTTDNFEAFNITDGGAVSSGNTVLDETTVYEGQGPGLVNDGASYLTTSNLQWNGHNYFNLPTRTILSNSGDRQIVIRYDTFTTAMGVDLLAFNGFGDSAVVEVFDSAGANIGTMTVTIPGNASPLFIGFEHAAGIGSVRLTHANWPWSPILNDHTYGVACPSDGCAGGELLKVKTRAKGCGCFAKAVLKNGTPGNSYGFAMPGGTCIQSVANSRGKAKAKECPSASGTVRVPACGLEAGAVCP